MSFRTFMTGDWFESLTYAEAPFLTMQRYGNVGVPRWQHIPYGFSMEEEATFGGYTIPSKIRGGWWFGTERYDPEAASTFEIVDAVYS